MDAAELITKLQEFSGKFPHRKLVLRVRDHKIGVVVQHGMPLSVKEVEGMGRGTAIRIETIEVPDEEY